MPLEAGSCENSREADTGVPNWPSSVRAVSTAGGCKLAKVPTLRADTEATTCHRSLRFCRSVLLLQASHAHRGR